VETIIKKKFRINKKTNYSEFLAANSSITKNYFIKINEVL